MGGLHDPSSLGEKREGNESPSVVLGRRGGGVRRVAVLMRI